MRTLAVVVVVLLASVLAPLATASASADPVSEPTPSFVVLLKEQRSHDASLAVRSAEEPAINALVERRNALVLAPEDRSDPAVLELDRQIDVALGTMRVRIASEASRLHAPSRDLVESFVATLGGTVSYRSPLLNMLVVRVPADRAAELARHPAVASVEREGTLDVLLDISVPATGAPAFWGGGFTGGPFKVIVADTGIDGTHPAISGKVNDAQTFHDAARLQGNYIDDWTTTDDLHSHGTHIGGNIASQDASLRGMAYGLLGVVNVKFGYLCNSWPGCGQGIWSDAFKGIDWGILTAGGDVLSFSFGGGANNDGTDAMSLYMDAVVDDLGVPVSVAAGNSGPGGGTLGQPAAAYNILTVGALDDRATVLRTDDVIAGFSSRGPTADGRLKPDITAPGSDIESTSNTWEGIASDWVTMSGTSMAAPHVAGGLELAMHASGGIAFPARAKALLVNTAQDLGAAGADNNYGWGSMNLNDAWSFRNFVVEGNATPGTPTWFTLAGSAGDQSSMVWQKHVVYNYASQPNPGAWQSWGLNNLDLALYDELPQTRLGLSNRLRDNVEQVSFASGTNGVLKVWGVGSLNGVAQEHFAIAAESALTPVTGPRMTMTLDAPPTANAGQNFVVTANVTNPGGLRVGTSTVTLTMPPGVSLVAGSNPASLGAIGPGGVRTATWTVSATIIGANPFSASASGAAYEESLSASAGPVIVMVADITPPTIQFPSAVPSPQNVGGPVNVSAAIFDNVGVTGAWADVTDPFGAFVGNFTLSVDPITGRRFDVRPYSTIGQYTYRISARDAAGNWNAVTGSFAIADLEAPQLAFVAASPDPQEVHFSVNVTGVATDNVGVTEIWLDVWDPLGVSKNETMSRSGVNVYLERVYDLVGVHTYFVTAYDAALNRAVRTGTFLIRDTTAPLADAGPDRSVEAGTTVVLDASASTDNVGIVTYQWTFNDGGPVTLFGVTASHLFPDPGIYLVTLTVWDGAGNSDPDLMTVTVVDAAPPTIADPRADPPVQDVGGAVAVSAVVYDEFGLLGVWLRVQDPLGGSVNTSMSEVAGRYTLGRAYAVKGLHLFEIWASDLNDNWASATGGFWVVDRIPPTVDAAATPDPQDVFSPVTVTATVADNDAVASVVMEAWDPSGALVAQGPMTLAGTEWTSSFVPRGIGPHTVIVRAADVSGNPAEGAAPVLVVDRTPPTLAANAPASVEVFTIADITATVSDNLGPVRTTLEVRDLDGRSLGNRSFPASMALPTAFLVLGPYAWTATAVDGSGNFAVASGTVNVVDTDAPSADAGPDRTVATTSEVALDASGSSDNYGIASYTWTFRADGRDQVLRRVREHVPFDAPQTVVVRLVVEDLAGNQAEDEAVITVVAPDSDRDGLSDVDEEAAGTNPTVPDTDGDEMPDGADPDPRNAEFDLVRTLRALFVSWYGVLILFVVFLVILLAGIRRRLKPVKEAPVEPRVAPARPAAVPAPPRPTRPLPPPPEDNGPPPPPAD